MCRYLYVRCLHGWIHTQNISTHTPLATPNPNQLTRNSRGLLWIYYIYICIPHAYHPTNTPTHDPDQLTRNSRVAVVGANGAGKSTLIKLLVGEALPDAGSGEVSVGI